MPFFLFLKFYIMKGNPLTTEQLRDLAKAIKKQLADDNKGFCVFVFNFNLAPGSGRCQYISNADRTDAAKIIDELMEHWRDNKTNESPDKN